MNGARMVSAGPWPGPGMSHVFFVESTLRPHPVALARSRGAADPRPLGESCGLHGRRLCPRRPGGRGRVHGAIGRCSQTLPRVCQDPAWLGRSPVIAFSGRKEPAFPAPQCVPGNSARRRSSRRLTKFSSPVESTAETAALVAPCLARCLGRAVRGRRISIFNGLQGRCHRARPDGTSRRPLETEGAGGWPGAPARWPRRATSKRRGSDPDRRRAGSRSSAGRTGAAVSKGRPRKSLGLGGGVGGPGGDDPLGPVASFRRPIRLSAGVAGSYSAPAGQPHRAQRRPGAVHRLRYRRPGHAELADSADQHTDRADRGPIRSDIGRSYPEHDGTGSAIRRRPWRAWGTSFGLPRHADHGFGRGRRPGSVADWRASMAPPRREEGPAPITVERLCAEVTRGLARGWGPRGRYRLFPASGPAR